jgi:hypothetical protein
MRGCPTLRPSADLLAFAPGHADPANEILAWGPSISWRRGAHWFAMQTRRLSWMRKWYCWSVAGPQPDMRRTGEPKTMSAPFSWSNFVLLHTVCQVTPGHRKKPWQSRRHKSISIALPDQSHHPHLHGVHNFSADGNGADDDDSGALVQTALRHQIFQRHFDGVLRVDEVKFHDERRDAPA